MEMGDKISSPYFLVFSFLLFVRVLYVHAFHVFFLLPNLEQRGFVVVRVHHSMMPFVSFLMSVSQRIGVGTHGSAINTQPRELELALLRRISQPNHSLDRVVNPLPPFLIEEVTDHDALHLE